MKTQVDEFLKTCRLHYRTLVVVSITALLFAIAPSEKERLSLAAEEAELVARMDFAQLYERAIRSNEKANEYLNFMSRICAGAHAIPPKPASQAFFRNTVIFPDQQATLQDLYDYARKKHRVVLSVPTLDDSLIEPIRQAVEKSRIDAKRRGNMDPDKEPFYSLSLTNRLRIKWERDMEGGEQVPHPISLTPVELQVDFVELMATDANACRLVQPSENGPTLVFPCLHEFWQEVRDLKPREAVSYLAARKARTNDRIDFLGLSIPAPLAGWAVVVTTFLLVVHLHLYVRRLVYLVQRDGEAPSEELYFPWLPLFQDRLSRVLTVISYPFLPIVANVLIMRRSFHLGLGSTIVLAIILTAFLDLYLSPRLIGRLRKLSQTEP